MRIDIEDFDNAVEKAVDALKKGNMIVYPTDTLYGLGANATSEEAVAKVKEAKGRDDGKPISIMCSGLPMIKEYCDVSIENKIAMIGMLPGPFTVILPVKKGLPGNLCEKTVGVRVPRYFFLLNVIKKCGFPITGTSANLSGGKSPCCIDDIPGSILDSVDVVIDGGKCPYSAPSTVVDMCGKKPGVLRQGAGIMPSEKSDFDDGIF
ncbi:MAG: L-threonylcarbamoyladenylate synthase [Candidatus Micrarchaeota archaeon]